jgi:hypothetical protein
VCPEIDRPRSIFLRLRVRWLIAAVYLLNESEIKNLSTTVRDSLKESSNMPKTLDTRPNIMSFVTSPEIWEILLEARKLRPFDSLSEIVREYLLVAHQVITTEQAKTDANITEIESQNV